jgi:nitrate reductase / nitrite oxidoreductase, alpha subunit
VVAAPLLHDTPDEMANPSGRVADWKHGECEPVPGRTMPKLVAVERDYGAIADKMASLGPLLDTLGATTQGRHLRGRPGDRLPAAQERRGPQRAALDRPGRAGVRGDPGVVRHHQRAPGDPGLPHPGEADRGTAGRPVRRARGQADHLRRHPGPADPRDHLAGVVRVGVGWAPLLPVRHQRRTAQTVAHADRPAELLPRPRLDGRAGGVAADLPPAAEHARAVR